MIAYGGSALPVRIARRPAMSLFPLPPPVKRGGWGRVVANASMRRY